MIDKKKSFKDGGEGSKIGNFLRSIDREDILKVGSVALNFATGNVGGALNSIKSLVAGDPNISTENKELALIELEKDIAIEQELTKRLQSDNEHSVTRLVRPLSYGFAWVILAFIMFFDGNVGEFSIDKVYIPLIQDLIKVMTVFYFGSRGIEKVVKEYKK